MAWETANVMDQRKRFVLKALDPSSCMADHRPDPPLAEVQVAEEERLLQPARSRGIVVEVEPGPLWPKFPFDRAWQIVDRAAREDRHPLRIVRSDARRRTQIPCDSAFVFLL